MLKFIKNLFKSRVEQCDIPDVSNQREQLIDFLTEIANSEAGRHNPQARIYKAKCLLKSINCC